MTTPTPGAMRAAIDKLEYAYQNRTSHYAHWDPTGGAGAGCPACQQEAKNNAAMKEAIAILKQEQTSIIDAETGLRELVGAAQAVVEGVYEGKAPMGEFYGLWSNLRHALTLAGKEMG